MEDGESTEEEEEFDSPFLKGDDEIIDGIY